MSYTPEFTPKYEDGWENLPIETTPIVAQALNDYDDALEHIEDYLANSQSIRDIKDIDLTGLANGNTIIYNSGSNKFVPGNAGSGGSSRLAELNDVSLTDPTNGEALVYNNGTWVNDATQSVARIYSATCDSQADVQNKVVTVSNDQQFKLVKGAVIFVKFSYTNQFYATASAHITLNVNSTGAIPIYAGNTNALIGIQITYYGRANFINQYVYDGTYWVWTGSSADNNSIYVNREALSGGIEQSLVTTGEKYIWNNKSDFGGAFDDLSDVQLTNLQNGQVPKYNSTSGKWENADDNNTVVVANPTESATEALEKLQVGSTVYDIPDNDDYTTGSTDITDDDLIVTKQDSNSTWYKKTFGKIWDYIKEKIGIADSGSTFLKKDGTWGTPTDNKVLQAVENDSHTPINSINSNFRVLLSSNNNDTETTSKSFKSNELHFNPSTSVLTLANNKNLTATQASMFTIGNSIADGVAGASHGQLRIYGKDQHRTNILDTYNVLTASRSLYIPNRTGYIATTNMAATDESTPTTVDNVTAKRADQAYVKGEHFIIDNQFCTAIADIASGAILTENTNYVIGSIADFLTVKTGVMTIPSAVSSWCEFTAASGNKLIFRQGNIVKVNTIVKITDMPALSAAAFILELPWENSQGVATFGQLNAYGQPYTMRTEAVYVGSGTTNKNKVGLRSSLPNGSYYVSLQYITTDPI